MTVESVACVACLEVQSTAIGSSDGRFNTFALPPPMADPENSIRDSESVIDEEQAQGTDLSFIHNRLVLTPFCR
jgi:hypothetical protein